MKRYYPSTLNSAELTHMKCDGLCDGWSLRPKRLCGSIIVRFCGFRLRASRYAVISRAFVVKSPLESQDAGTSDSTVTVSPGRNGVGSPSIHAS